MFSSTLSALTLRFSKKYAQTTSRKEKSTLLDAYCLATGFHRKYASEKLRTALGWRVTTEKKRRGKKKHYSAAVTALLTTIWESYNGICGERLYPILGEALEKLSAFGHVSASTEEKEELLRMSLSTVKRCIRQERERFGKSPLSSTKPGSLLKKAIPIQTRPWDPTTPGYEEIDLVAHCGGSLQGEFINTLQTVDLCTTWTERKAVLGKGQERVFHALKEIRMQLPFPLKGIDSDNGSEFINHQLQKYCTEEQITFTRSRPYISKDNAHIEQKNYPLVRKVLGYDRFETTQTLELINDLYDHELRLYSNFILPSLKLKEKIRIGAKYKRVYEPAKTPYQRVMDHDATPTEVKQQLTEIYRSLDPIYLKNIIDKKVLKIIRSAR